MQVAQRWILARLRNETFFSLEALSASVRELLDELNVRSMKRLGGKTRRELFASLDKPALKALPDQRFVCAEWGIAKVHGDYHIEAGTGEIYLACALGQTACRRGALVP